VNQRFLNKIKVCVTGIHSTFFDDEDSSLLGLNYVFPVKTSAPSGHCKGLKQLFNLTEVMPWQILSADRGRLPLSNRAFTNLNTKISSVKNEPVFYLMRIRYSFYHWEL